jgi:hypothetical protein
MPYLSCILQVRTLKNTIWFPRAGRLDELTKKLIPDVDSWVDFSIDAFRHYTVVPR